MLLRAWSIGNGATALRHRRRVERRQDRRGGRDAGNLLAHRLVLGALGEDLHRALQRLELALADHHADVVAPFARHFDPPAPAGNGLVDLVHDFVEACDVERVKVIVCRHDMYTAPDRQTRGWRRNAATPQARLGADSRQPKTPSSRLRRGRTLRQGGTTSAPAVPSRLDMTWIGEKFAGRGKMWSNEFATALFNPSA